MRDEPLRRGIHVNAEVAAAKMRVDWRAGRALAIVVASFLQ